MATITTSQAVNCPCCGGPSPSICFPPTPRYICWHCPENASLGIQEIKVTFELHSIVNQGPFIIARYVAYSYYYSHWCTFFLDIECPRITPSPFPGSYSVWIAYSDPFAYAKSLGCWGSGEGSPGLNGFDSGVLSSASPVAASPFSPGRLIEGSCLAFVGPDNQGCVPDFVSGSLATFSLPNGSVHAGVPICAGRGQVLSDWRVVRPDLTSYGVFFTCNNGVPQAYGGASFQWPFELIPRGLSASAAGLTALFETMIPYPYVPGYEVPGFTTISIPSVAHPPQTPPSPTTGNCAGALAGAAVALTLTGSVAPGTYLGVWSTLRSGQDVAVFSTASGIVLVRWWPDGTSNMVMVTGLAGTISYTAPAVIGPVCGPPAMATYDNGSGFSGVLVTL